MPGRFILKGVKIDRDLHAVSRRTTHRHDDARLVLFAALSDDHALRARLLSHHGRELAQQQFTRRHCFGQTQRQQLRQRRLLLGALRGSAGEKFQFFFSMRQIGLRTELAEMCSTRG